jgi:hypothetical protein
MTAPKTSMDPEESASAQRLAGYLKVGVPVGTVVLTIVAGFVQGPALAILVLAGGALIAVIATFWTSVRTLFGETPLSGADAYALGAPRAEEEQKQSVLRALKDLEFERSVGKISEEDYKALVAKYRAEAKRLLRLLDTEAQPRRAHVEALVAKRLKREGLLDGDAAADAEDASKSEAAEKADAEDESDEARVDEASGKEAAAAEKAPTATSKKKQRGAAAKGSDRKKKAATEPARKLPAETEKTDGERAARVCVACSTSNDSDAAFCKKCGARLDAPSKKGSETPSAAETTDDGAGAS